MRSELREYAQGPDYNKWTSFFSNFHNDLYRIIEAYSAGATERPVDVIIGDGDRCEPANIADLMASINLISGSDQGDETDQEDPDLLFFIAMGRQKVAAALAAENKSLQEYLSPSGPEPLNPSDQSKASGHSEESVAGVSTPASVEFGQNYIERVIQIPFQIPQADIANLDGTVGEASATETEELEIDPVLRLLSSLNTPFQS